jgi:hypothetical protein
MWSKNVFTCPIILVDFKNAIFAHQIIFLFLFSLLFDFTYTVQFGGIFAFKIRQMSLLAEELYMYWTQESLSGQKVPKFPDQVDHI